MKVSLKYLERMKAAVRSPQSDPDFKLNFEQKKKTTLSLTDLQMYPKTQGSYIDQVYTPTQTHTHSVCVDFLTCFQLMFCLKIKIFNQI